jgi:transcription antitermination factor NusG
MFVELDYQNQSFLPITATPDVTAVISAAGVPWPVPQVDVDDLFDRSLTGEFNETKGGLTIGARVAIVAGKFENWLATVTGIEKGGQPLAGVTIQRSHRIAASCSTLLDAEVGEIGMATSR